MKLNYKRTILVGLAFLSICAFWQLYDAVVPLVLKNTFGMPDDTAGVVMAADNVLALFLLPFFGMLSDKSHSGIGKRMPYILAGTAVAAVLMNLLPLADKQGNLVFFLVALGFLLLAMGVYRSPAVALMPDVTPKPLRSKGNAIINLMGALGGVFTLGVTGVLVKKTADGVPPDYTWLFAAVAVLMVVTVAILFGTVRENKLRQEVEALEPPEAPASAAVQQPGGGTGKASGFAALDPAMRRSLILILCSVFLWFMGYNAVTTAFTKYAQALWGAELGTSANYLLIATVGAVVSYLPVGYLATRFGRKRVIQGGILLLALCFATGILFVKPNVGIYIMFAAVGAAWAMINVNSYPMVVEISKSGDVGKFTGYYYTFSMSAQIATPILSGWLLEHVGYWTLFPYAAVMVALSFVTISMTRHGDSKPLPPASKLEAFQEGDA